MRSASAQPNWSIARIAIRCAVCGRRPKRRSCARTASANSPPPGTTSSGWRAPASAIAVHSARSASSPASRASPPPTLTTVSTRRSGRELGERGRGRRVALRRAPRQLEHRAAEALRHRAGEERPDAERHDRRRAAPRKRAPTRRAAASIWRDLLGVEVRGDRLDLGGRELLHVGADEPRDALARALDARRPPVRRRARVGLGRQVPEDQVHVAADREQLRRDRAPAPADRDARSDRREVRAQRAGVDELARQQPVEVGATRRRRRGRPRSGSRRRSCCPRRASARPDAARRPRGRSPPSWRRRRRAAAPAPRRGSRARPRS